MQAARKTDLIPKSASFKWSSKELTKLCHVNLIAACLPFLKIGLSLLKSQHKLARDVFNIRHAFANGKRSSLSINSLKIIARNKLLS